LYNSVNAIIINILLLISIFNRIGFSNPQFITTKQSADYSETWLDDNSWIWRGSIGAPDFIFTDDGFISIRAEALKNDSRLAYPSLPCFSKIFNAMPEDISYQINGSSRVVLPVNGKPERFSDRSKPDNEEFEFDDETVPDIGNIYPRETVIITFLGYVNNLPLTSVRIYPYQLIDNGRQLRYYEELSVSVSIANNSNLRILPKAAESNLENALDLSSQVRRSLPGKILRKPGSHFLFGRKLMRITVDSTGIYRITRAVLKDSGAAIKNIDPRSLQLFNRGKEVPIYVKGESDGSFDKSDYIEFYGQRNPNSVADYYYDPFTDKNVYFLTWGEQDGLRYAEESAKTTISSNNAIVPVDYEYTTHFEENSHFDRLGKVDTDRPTHTRDHWFFDSGINGGTTRIYSFPLIHPNMNTIERFNIEVGMHGLTYQAGNHTVSVYINDYYTAVDSWSDQTPHIIRNDAGQVLQNRYLKHGENKIQLAVAGDDPTNKYDKVLFDYLNIRYKRLYRAHKDRIDFTRPENMPIGVYHFKIDGFEDPDISVYKIGKSKLMDFSVEYSTLTDNYSVLIEDYIHDDNTFYIAASRAGIMQPRSIQADTIFNITAEGNSVDLLIISDQQYKYKLAKLISFYQSIGINAQAVGIRDIYNEFNDGIVSPYAIRDYLAYIHANRAHKPHSVLLIGDSKIREEEYVPAFFNQSYKYGACPSDQWYVVFDEKSGIPEYAIGRWPVSDWKELELVIDKRINYTNEAPVGPWRNEMLYIAGFEDVFKNQTENMINRQVPKEFSINRIFINPSSVKTPFFGGSDTLIYLFNKGLTLINFMGHGGGAVWSDRSLFNTSHIEYLDNYNKLPFITSLTCFTADFTNVTGLGEHLLIAENGGAIGLWGATSVGWIKNDYLMAKPFYDVIFNPGITVGEAIQYAKIKYLADHYFDYLKFSMVNSYMLIGDPTITIPFPGKQSNLTISESNPQPGQTIELSGLAPFASGEIYTQLYDSATFRVFPEPQIGQIENSTVRQSIQLPFNINPGNTFINYYFNNTEATDDGHGVTLLSIRGLNFYSFNVQPELPKKGEDFIISVRTELANIDSFICEMDTVSAYEYLDENGIEFVSSFNNPASIIKHKMAPDNAEPNRWYLQSPMKIGTAGKLIGVRFAAYDNSQNQTVSNAFSVKIKQNPDLAVIGISQGGTTFPELLVEVNYNGNDTLQTDMIAYKVNGSVESIFNTAQIRLLPNRKSTHAISGILGTGWQQFKIVIDPLNKINELNEANNTLTDSLYINTFPVLPATGTSLNGINTDTLKFDRYSILIKPNSLTDSSALIFNRKLVSQNSNQPQFSIQNSIPGGQFESIEILLPNVSDTLLKPLRVEIFSPDTADHDVSIARRDSYLKIWIKQTTQHQRSSYVTESFYPGQFTLIKCQDTEPPALELSLDGQQFFQDSYVARRPNISIIGEDKNGVRFDSKGLKVKLDDNTVNFSELNIPDTLINGNYISAQFRPDLDYGEHIIEVALCDAAGNITGNEIIFTVSDELKLIDYGNYPNPFKDRTTFIYELTQWVEKFKINIYAPSGRLIKVLEEATIFSTGLDMNEGGYHEIMWDGLDEDGNFIANGVYFYKMIAKKQNKKVTSIGKIAKAR